MKPKIRCAKIEHEILRHEPDLAEARDLATNAETEVSAADEALQSLQISWEEFNQQAAKTGEAVSLGKSPDSTSGTTHLTHKQTPRSAANDKDRINFYEMNKEIEESSQKSYEAADKLEAQSRQLSENQTGNQPSAKRPAGINSALDQFTR